jgi:hypothetical protein
VERDAKVKKEMKDETKRTLEHLVQPRKRTRADYEPGATAAADPDVHFVGVQLNHSEDPHFWLAQSPKEIRAQLALRHIPRHYYEHLSKADLIGYIGQLIMQGSW